MSFRDHDKKTFIADTARAYAERRISKRDFMKKMSLAGVGFSAFAAGLLGNTRPYRGNLGLLGTEALAQDASVTQWLKDVGAPSRAPRSATPRKQPRRRSFSTSSRTSSPSRPASKSKSRSCRSSRFSPRRRRTCRPARHLRSLLPRPVLGCDLRSGHHRSGCLLQGKAGPGHAGVRLRRLLQAAGLGLAEYEGKWVGIPFDIPIFMLMYRKDILEKHGIAVPTSPPNSPLRSRRSPRPRRPMACSAPGSRPSRATTR